MERYYVENVEKRPFDPLIDVPPMDYALQRAPLKLLTDESVGLIRPSYCHRPGSEYPPRPTEPFVLQHPDVSPTNPFVATPPANGTPKPSTDLVA
ncbi:hypothetical protein G7Y89_g11513 [Cudoniella acicularis]|uniref:Uncharacterized protein n=1 Tax=Cudoniella acicularis TaxID=354080 RepID=A0A8H4RAS3_9HELO|nr:hypothetical protein G7Y89_g11513 [Cudoniella acicularis]